MKNAGRYRHLIKVYEVIEGKDREGYKKTIRQLVMTAYASVKTTKGYTLIANNSDFEKAYTNFTIRTPGKTKITRDMIIEFSGKLYEIAYLNNVDEAGVELEIQAKEVTH